MKKIYAIFSLLIILTTSATAQTSGLQFYNSKHNFGEIEETSKNVSHRFKYKNTSGERIVIVDVMVSCGCTIPQFSRAEIKPNQTGEITINYDPYNRPGRIDKKITVVTNLGKTDLYIDGVVKPRQRSLEESFPFMIGQGLRLNNFATAGIETPLGEYTTTVVMVANTNNANSIFFDIDAISMPRGVSAKVNTNMIPPKGIAEITITNQGVEYGKFKHSIKFLINGSRTNDNYTISGVVIDNFKGGQKSNPQPQIKQTHAPQGKQLPSLLPTSQHSTIRLIDMLGQLEDELELEQSSLEPVVPASSVSSASSSQPRVTSQKPAVKAPTPKPQTNSNLPSIKIPLPESPLTAINPTGGKVPIAVLSQTFMNLGEISSNSRSHFSLMIRNQGSAPLIIRKVESSNNILAETTETTVPPNGRTFLKITYTPTATGFDTGIITVIVNDPVSPTLEMRTVAEVF